ncbi:MAG TPA: sigma-70 family RNA polymerase sigma factor [Candidatus Angelobacter sp.]|nr:sigma-70 family RNA polymerase sigma factor [Candidatus Angelobacter sp.]
MKKADPSVLGPGHGTAQNLHRHLPKTAPREHGGPTSEVQYSPTTVDFHSFDAEYLRLLQGGDSVTEDHFYQYFSGLIQIKLRSRRIREDILEEVRQETFLRVLRVVRDGGVRQAGSFGSYVNSVCDRVLFEHYRKYSRDLKQVAVDAIDEMPDDQASPEDYLTAERTREAVSEVLDELSEKDRDILRAVFMTQDDREEICRKFKVRNENLRIMLHRAKERFRSRCKDKDIVNEWD